MQIQVIELVSTDDLIEELASRHEEIIIIRECKKSKGCDDVFVKTGFGDLARKDKDFDLMRVVIILQAALRQLTMDFFKQ